MKAFGSNRTVQQTKTFTRSKKNGALSRELSHRNTGAMAKLNCLPGRRSTTNLIRWESDGKRYEVEDDVDIIWEYADV